MSNWSFANVASVAVFDACSDVYIEMFRRWKWEQVALLAEDGQSFPEYHVFLKDLFLSRSIQVVYDRKMPRQTRMEDAAKVLITAKSRTLSTVHWKKLVC
jgi:uncharacterized membrane protein